MDAEFFLSAAKNVAILSIFFLVGQWWLLRFRSRQISKRHVDARLKSSIADAQVEEKDVKLVGSRFERLQLKAGLELEKSSLFLMMLSVIAAALLIGFLFGVLAAIFVPVVAIIFAAAYWSFRYQRRRRAVFEGLPDVIDDVVRGVDAGRSLEQALVDSFNDAAPVFSPLSFRLRSAVEAGRDYTDLMDDFARLYSVPPLVFVAVALRTSSRFGSSVRPVLKKVSQALRSQQEMRREFIAATAEIRFTAVAFAVLPVGIGVGLVSMNESFRHVLLDTDTGNKLLGVSIGFVVVGVLIISRMVQGVGRG
ncbi:type II secretion system F family protein [Alcanivorax sp.]|jgi:tight adherence protein B|uniref:type II secretion system F family protein n=1 Tax=Alcanivorax sp. TaxID=1872427 RepID=UPI0032D999B7